MFKIIACTKPGKSVVMYLCGGGIIFAYFYCFSIGFWNCFDSVVFLLFFPSFYSLFKIVFFINIFSSQYNCFLDIKQTQFIHIKMASLCEFGCNTIHLLHASEGNMKNYSPKSIIFPEGNTRGEYDTRGLINFHIS